MEREQAMSWVEAMVRTRFAASFRRSLRNRDRGEGLAAQAVIIGVTAVIGTAILTTFMNGLGQIFTAMLNTIGRIVPGGVSINGG